MMTVISTQEEDFANDENAATAAAISIIGIILAVVHVLMSAIPAIPAVFRVVIQAEIYLVMATTFMVLDITEYKAFTF